MRGEHQVVHGVCETQLVQVGREVNAHHAHEKFGKVGNGEVLVVGERLQGDVFAVMLVDIVDDARDALVVVARLRLLRIRAFHLEAGKQLRDQRVGEALGAKEAAFVVGGIIFHKFGDEPLNAQYAAVIGLRERIAVEKDAGAVYQLVVKQRELDLYGGKYAIFRPQFVRLIGIDEDHVVLVERIEVPAYRDLHRAGEYQEDLDAVVPVAGRMAELVDEALHRHAFAKVDDFVTVFHVSSLCAGRHTASIDPSERVPAPGEKSAARAFAQSPSTARRPIASASSAFCDTPSHMRHCAGNIPMYSQALL